MRTLGIIGGIGPDSTIVYYRLITAACRERGIEPSLIINSISMRHMLGLAADGKLEELTSYLAGEVGKLVNAGAAVALLAANTPHIVFDRLRGQLAIPLVSIVEAGCEEAAERNLRRLALFGTRFTMQASFYPDAFSRAGMEIVLPAQDEQAFIHEKYMTELTQGRYLSATRERLLAIAARLRRDQGIDAVILGGTELPLLLRDETLDGMPLLDTTKIHVTYALRQVLAN